VWPCVGEASRHSERQVDEGWVMTWEYLLHQPTNGSEGPPQVVWYMDNGF